MFANTEQECSCSCSCSSSWCHIWLHAPKAVLLFFWFCFLSQGFKQLAIDLCVCERVCNGHMSDSNLLISLHLIVVYLCVCFPGLEQLYCSLWNQHIPSWSHLSTSMWNKNKVATQSVVSGQMEAAKAPKLANKKPRVKVVLSSTAFHFFYFHIRIQHLLRFSLFCFLSRLRKCGNCLISDTLTSRLQIACQPFSPQRLNAS